MKTHGIRLVIVLALFVLSACGISKGSGSPTEPTPIPPGQTQFIVRVLDNGNVPVSQAAVDITGSQNYQAVTGEAGTVSTQLPYGSYNVSVSSFGFNGADQVVELNSPNKDLTFNLVRRDEVKTFRVEPPCGTLNLPYVFNSIIVEIGVSVAQEYEYPMFGYLNSSLSTDGVNPILGTGGGGRFGYAYLYPVQLVRIQTGLMDHFRDRINNTTHIINELSVKDKDDAAKRIGVLYIERYECPFSFN